MQTRYNFYVAGCVATLENGEQILITENPKVIYDTLDESLDAAKKIVEEHKNIDPSAKLEPIYGVGSFGFLVH